MEIWTDGSCHPNPGPGGWGYVRSDGVEACGGERKTTNNRMEMKAILEALIKLPDGHRVTIYSDSQYCVKGLTTWRKGWKRKGWRKKGADMPNRDLWIELEGHLERIDITVKWVRGHDGNWMNEKADNLANDGRNGFSYFKEGKEVQDRDVAISVLDERENFRLYILQSINDIRERLDCLENIINKHFQSWRK